MPNISDFPRTDILSLQDDLRAVVRNCVSLEQAAQRAVSTIYEALSGSAVLVRLFATVPFRSLPGDIQARVQELASRNLGEEVVREDALILTLLGTRGLQAAWDHRQQSAGHAGVPLVSARFVEAIPMVSRLLQELGVDLRWFDHADLGFVETKLAGGLAGLFYVRDAASATDAGGRLIIPSQSFVAEHGVKTVFGLGGAYAEGTIFTLIVFTKHLLEKEEVEPYVRLVSPLKAATASLVREKRLFG